MTQQNFDKPPDEATVHEWIKRIFAVATLLENAPVREQNVVQKHKSDKVRYGNDTQPKQQTK